MLPKGTENISMKKVCGLVCYFYCCHWRLVPAGSWDNNDWWDRGKPLVTGAIQTKTEEYDKLANYLQKELGVIGGLINDYAAAVTALGRRFRPSLVWGD